MTYGLKAFVNSVNNCLVAIQGFSTLLHERLVNELKEGTRVDGPSQFEQEEDYFVSGLYCITYNNADSFIKDQDMFAVDLLQSLQENDQARYKMVLHSTSLLFAEVVNELLNIVVERDEMNEPTDSLPSVLPPDLLKFRPFGFAQLVALHNV